MATWNAAEDGASLVVLKTPIRERNDRSLLGKKDMEQQVLEQEYSTPAWSQPDGRSGCADAPGREINLGRIYNFRRYQKPNWPTS